MPLSSIGEGAVHNGGGGALKCEVYNRSNPSFFGKTFCVPANLITRADKLLRVLMIHFACGWFTTRADTDMT